MPCAATPAGVEAADEVVGWNALVPSIDEVVRRAGEAVSAPCLCRAPIISGGEGASDELTECGDAFAPFEIESVDATDAISVDEDASEAARAVDGRTGPGDGPGDGDKLNDTVWTPLGVEERGGGG